MKDTPLPETIVLHLLFPFETMQDYVRHRRWLLACGSFDKLCSAVSLLFMHDTWSLNHQMFLVPDGQPVLNIILLAGGQPVCADACLRSSS